MAKIWVGAYGRSAGAAILALALVLAGCAPRVGGPAPLVGGEPSPPPPARIVVQRGQSLSQIAHIFHVPMQALAQANNLSPPYRILAGQSLAIPGGVEPPTSAPQVAVAALPGEPSHGPAPPSASPPPARTLGPSAGSPTPTTQMPAGSPAAKSTVVATPLPAPDKPAPPQPAAVAPPSASADSSTPPTSAPNSLRPPAEPPSAPQPARGAHESPPATATSTHGGGFQWPVRGRILEAYGTGGDGTHNDGINIAAPRGAAVQATDAGVVAYAGNELRGYGNLILIKHPSGWISAYAHCDLILVKKGEKVSRGQVIARVGSTGNVSEPQLHFELRRGNKPVDPREYLAPLPTASSKDEKSG